MIVLWENSDLEVLNCDCIFLVSEYTTYEKPFVKWRVLANRNRAFY